MKLYNFFRSSTSHRLRIALGLKGLTADYVAVDLRTEAHRGAAFKALNPQGMVPALEADGEMLTQSPAIIDWLEERYPLPALLPADPLARARVRAVAAVIGCDIHPLHNRRVLQALRETFGADEAAVNAWCARWIEAGFDAAQALLTAPGHPAGDFCFGTAPGLADVYLVPQVESARRFKVDIGRWPRLQAIDAACSDLDAFRLAAPGVQPDAVAA
jgi:maleylpyruvate isomerase